MFQFFVGIMGDFESSGSNILCKNPHCEKPNQKCNTILRHIALAKDCKNFYSDQDKEDLKGQSSALLAKKKSKWEAENYNPTRRKQRHQKEYNPAQRKEKHKRSMILLEGK